jgi:hypothetical protein
MLEFTLLAWDSENYNIINWALTGISIVSFEPVERISEAGIGLSCLIGRLSMLELTLSMGIYCCEVPKRAQDFDVAWQAVGMDNKPQ